MGKHLVRKLYHDDCLVYVTSREYHASDKNVVYLKGNAKDINFIRAVLNKEHYDAIYNFMTYTTEQFTDVVKELLQATDQYFFFSSARVYADSDKPIHESSPRLLDCIDDREFLATDNYALTKARQENILKDSGFNNWTIIRPYLTYSESRLQLGLFEQHTWLMRALQGKTIVFSKDIADKYTTLTYGSDVAEILYLLLGKENALGKVIQITCEKALKWSEILSIYIKEIKNISGKEPKVKMLDNVPLNIMPSELWTYKYDRGLNRRFKSEELSQILGFTYNFTSPEVGLKKCIRCFAQQPSAKGFSWMLESMQDRITGEFSLPSYFPWKEKLLYVLCRFWGPSSFFVLKKISDYLKKIKQSLFKRRTEYNLFVIF